MSLSFTERKRLRHTFGKHKEVALHGLISIQTDSYKRFLQADVEPSKRGDFGLQKVFNSCFPIVQTRGNAKLEFVEYRIEEPKDDDRECPKKGLTYASPLKVKLRLTIYKPLSEGGSETKRAVLRQKEQEVYIGDLPIMSSRGTFIVNGVERVVVSQLHRSAGIFFDLDKPKSSGSNKNVAVCRLIPSKGSWLDFEMDVRNVIYVKIDRRKKLPATSLLYALGMDSHSILNSFYHVMEQEKNPATGSWEMALKDPSVLEDMRFRGDILGSKSEVLVPAGKRVSKDDLEILKSHKRVILGDRFAMGQYAAEDILDEPGSVICAMGELVEPKIMKQIEKAGISKIKTVGFGLNQGAYMINTIRSDKTNKKEEALIDIHRILRPGEAVIPSVAEKLFHDTFFNSDLYDLSFVGAMKIKSKLGVEFEDGKNVLSKDLIIAILRYLCLLQDGKGEVDDVDHLGNRRVRSVGELLENQMIKGIPALQRATKEQMDNLAEDDKDSTPQSVIVSRYMISPIREFFNSSELSQFMDQTNPLSELAHKRRISALGQGGLNRERAGFEVRDVHPTHYGRICPIETPEGANIGLVNSFAIHSSVNQYGFLETPYFPVKNGKVDRNSMKFLNALDELDFVIAAGSAKQDKEGKLLDNLINCRKNNEFVLVKPDQVDYIDVSPKQVISVSASLIPCLENDDANRALMGSNMQRQAVPLIRPKAPLVGTGMERIVARDSGVNLIAKRDGIVKYVDSRRIVVECNSGDDFSKMGVDVYRLEKFNMSNSGTCINQKPLVVAGDKVKAGDLMSDSACMDSGELALGNNVLVLFASHKGYNFEDAIVVSQNLVKEDAFTSVHIKEFTCTSRDTKLGPEEVTRNIPNVGEEMLAHLDEAGIAHIGAKVKEGDILVGKVIPKGETIVTPEEKLLRTIFGQRVAEVKDVSLRVPPGVSGTVVGATILNREGLEKDYRTLAIESERKIEINRDKQDIERIYQQNIFNRLEKLILGADLSKKSGSHSKVSAELLKSLPKKDWWSLSIKDKGIAENVAALEKQYKNVLEQLKKSAKRKTDKVESSSSLVPGVLKVVNVHLAVKRNLQTGDKMAGRHGNKGVIATVLPIEDMPYLEDGTPVDMVLNPLGVPSRMNVGQILETHLGWASSALGGKISKILNDAASSKRKDDILKLLKEIYNEEEYAEISKLSDAQLKELAKNLQDGVPMSSPVFDGISEEDIVSYLDKAGLDKSGQVTVYDGCTGDLMKRKATVGYIYMMKLHHLVDDKIHGRSTGPYSLVTQQPLGGKSQFGGQRLGEMEVWALQAHGAAYNVMEMLTVKSDDVQGRNRMFSSIVRGYPELFPGIPESFNVLVKEMRSLGLDVSLNTKEK